MASYDDIFSMPTDVNEITQNVVSTKGAVDENLYIPKLDDAPDGVYKATLRFLPNPNNVRQSTISKIVYFLKDANGENGFYVDSPKTVGEDCPMAKMYWDLKESKNVIEQKLAENINRMMFNYSLVEILKDPQHPELVGQIKVFRYGKKVKDMVEKESHDEDEPCNVFDPFNGKNFNLVVKKVSNYPNYDSSKFSSSTPMQIDGEKVPVSEAGKKKVLAFLKNAPDLSVYEYKEWSEETRERVYKNLRTFTPKPIAGDTGMDDDDDDDSSIENIVSQKSEKKPSGKASRKPVNDDDDDDFFAAPKSEKKPAKPSKKVEEDEDEDDFFNMDDLNL